MNEKQLARFLAKIDKDPDTGCWNWAGHLNHTGYGHIVIDGKQYRAHRISAAHYKGFDLNSKLFICHTCDNPKCVNPEHLFIGTHADNVQDMIEKGRHNKPVLRALNRKQINDIKFWFHQAENRKTKAELARNHGVDERIIRKILSGKTYQDWPLYAYA